MSQSINDQEPDGGYSTSGDDHDGISESVDGHPASAVPFPACRSCRSRKVRCDRKDSQTPCTACTRRGTDCLTPTGARVRGKRRRVLVSNSYEDKIDALAKRLDQIFDFVAGQGIHPSRAQQADSRSHAASRIPDTTVTAQQIPQEPNSDVEDEHVLAVESAFATSYAQENLSHSINTLETNARLHSLGRIIESQNTYAPNVKPQYLFGPGDKLGNVKMPPLELALSCIQELRSSPSVRFLWTWDIDTIGQLLEITTKVYTSKASDVELIIVNSTLSRLLPICTGNGDTVPAQVALEPHVRQCQINLDALLCRIPFNLKPDFNNALAFYQAAINSMERGKTLTAWNYIAAAVHMYHSLGFFRQRALVPEQPQEMRRRKRLAWMILIVDKSLSLRLGRSSTIRKSEFTLGKPIDTSQDDVPAIGPSAMLGKWVEFSLLQGRIFDELYSPVALLESEHTRTTRAQSLATKLRQVFYTVAPLEQRFYQERSVALGDDMNQLLCVADRINLLATLTLIYRVIPNGSQSSCAFCDECVHTAQEALDEHVRCLGILRNVKGSVVAMYFQWAFLSSPFIPFFVLFCRTFETCDPAHVERLRSVVELLQLMPEGSSSASARQLRIFKPMYEVARNFVESHQNGKDAGRIVSDADFDIVYQGITTGLSSFGAGEQVQRLEWNGNDETIYMHAANEWGNWFEHSQRLQSLLEDSFDP